ncbi:MAG: ribulose-phosphate 3-epimerase [Candidatus Latescibacteria bacterium]|nr:ribulose-phosphate 3-epimerase [Candidatus Latescibacterota bacterium]
MNWWSRYAEHATAVAPSLLSADFADLGRDVARMESAGADLFHLDVMDGQFVPNLTFGPLVVAAVRRRTALQLDAHLMVSRPERHLAAFARAGADAITVHIEAVPDPGAALAEIGSLGVRRGLSLNPGTPLDAVLPWLDRVDLVLVMSVQPGAGGQSFQPAALDKLRGLTARRAADGLGFAISIDGGVNDATAPACRGAGADILVAGSYLFGAADPAAAIAALR